MVISLSAPRPPFQIRLSAPRLPFQIHLPAPREWAISREKRIEAISLKRNLMVKSDVMDSAFRLLADVIFTKVSALPYTIMFRSSVTVIITTTTIIFHYHHLNHHDHLSLSSSQPQRPSVTARRYDEIVISTTWCQKIVNQRE